MMMFIDDSVSGLYHLSLASAFKLLSLNIVQLISTLYLIFPNFKILHILYKLEYNYRYVLIDCNDLLCTVFYKYNNKLEMFEVQ